MRSSAACCARRFSTDHEHLDLDWSHWLQAGVFLLVALRLWVLIWRVLIRDGGFRDRRWIERWFRDLQTESHGVHRQAVVMAKLIFRDRTHGVVQEARTLARVVLWLAFSFAAYQISTVSLVSDSEDIHRVAFANAMLAFAIGFINFALCRYVARSLRRDLKRTWRGFSVVLERFEREVTLSDRTNADPRGGGCVIP